jgi:hypothetical protein
MKTKVLAIVAVCGFVLAASVAEAGYPAYYLAMRAKARTIPWHGAYYDLQWGEPVALVVPPTAEKQTHYRWGVTHTEVTPIFHEFGRRNPGPAASGEWGFAPQPYWPSSTNQFGVYYVRGPW